MKRFFTYSLLAIMGVSATSCATVLTGTSDTITFNTTPQGAKVYDRGIEKCVTPCSFKVTRSLSEKTIEIKKDGFNPKVVELDTKFNTISILNLFGIVGWGIDAATGALKKYDTKVYNIELEKK